jgi:hypothetical protein
MRQKFYYLRDEYRTGNVPYACVCLLEDDDGRIARGISVCSGEDNFIKQIGRGKALGYAMRALKTGQTVYKRLYRGLKIMLAIIYKTVNKGDIVSEEYLTKFKLLDGKYQQSALLTDESDVPLTDFEKNILADR